MRTTPRWMIPPALVLAVLVAATGCGGSDDAAPDPTDDVPSTTTVLDLCTSFPTRDAMVMLEAPDSPALQGNREAIESLLEIGADGLVDAAPATIKPAVETYVAAMRAWEPGTDLTDDPTTRAAVAEINAWLEATCPPPPATTPDTSPGTAPP